jgi:putative hydrolase of the HAD superfamily
MPFSHIDTWIFDMDHCLYTANKDIHIIYQKEFYNYVSNTHNIPLDEVSDYLDKMIEKHGEVRVGLIKENGFDFDHWTEVIGEVIEDLLHTHIPPNTLTVKLLNNMSGKKIVCTNAGDVGTNRILTHLGMENTFHHINDFKTRGYISKPNPDVYTNLMTELNLNPKTCAFFEDTATNLKPAHELGMTTVLVHGEKEGRDYIHHAYPSLLDFLKEQNNAI